jgi:hypothetical protein
LAFTWAGLISNKFRLMDEKVQLPNPSGTSNH